jgi:hypothetical protein
MARNNTRTCLLLVYMLITLATLANSRPTEASTLEKWLIMPGPVVRSHASAENACDSCHDPLSDQPQFELCVTCHADVGDDLKGNVGLHGRLPEAQRFECVDCHTDHEGRDKIIVELGEAAFDHALTDFLLRGAHKGVSCNDCHEDGKKHREASSTCIGCHRVNDPHNEQFAQACDSCHNSSNWSEINFDHNATAFPLTGMHDSLSCTACHQSNTFTNVDRSCIACHRTDDEHEGRNGSLCADCHNTEGWSKAIFSHLAVAGFGLDGGHQGLGCQDCHRSSDFRDLGGSNCNACHRSDDVHETRNGSDCASCHVVASWRTIEFDHASHANVPLPTGHAALECNTCHKGDIHDALPRSCAGCHRNEDAHKGQLGTQCESCHVATDWISRVWFDHDLVSFPLMGTHAEVACDRCHSSAAFHDAGTDCAACHASDDLHRGAFGKQCDACHNPSTWRSWQFDHDTQTSFVLSGSHAAIACTGCHKAPLRDRSATSSDCIACHRREDRHSGRFGKNCGSCHNTSSFSQIEGL